VIRKAELDSRDIVSRDSILEYGGSNSDSNLILLIRAALMMLADYNTDLKQALQFIKMNRENMGDREDLAESCKIIKAK
jgi:hypothetical protein